MSDAPVDHAVVAADLLRLWDEDREDMTEMARWEYLTAAQAHATLAAQGSQQQGVAVMAELLAAMTKPAVVEPPKEADPVD